MSQELFFSAPGKISFRQVERKSVDAKSLLIQTHLTGIRHGFDSRILNERCVDRKISYPFVPSCWGVGKVIEVGNLVNHFRVGDMVHGPMIHAEFQILSEHRAYSLKWIKKEFSVFLDPGRMALRCIHAANIRFGDRVAIFGMGAIGLMALQYALFNGARVVIAVDPNPSRLKVAQRLGSHFILSTEECKKVNWTVELSPVDTSIDLSGSDAALYQSLDCLAPEGRLVAETGMYDQDTMESVRSMCEKKGISLVFPQCKYDQNREEETVFYSIEQKKAIVWPIISDYVPFQEAERIYEKLQRDPGKHIKVLLKYD